MNNELLHVTDWLPTLTHIAACGVHGDVNCTGPALGDIDGVNQWQAITGSSFGCCPQMLILLVNLGGPKFYQIMH